MLFFEDAGVWLSGRPLSFHITLRFSRVKETLVYCDMIV